MTETIPICSDGCLTVPAAVVFSSYSRSVLYEAMGRGELQFVKRGRKRVIPKRALVAFMEKDVQGGNGEQEEAASRPR